MTKAVAADGVTEVYNLPGVGLVVSAVAFNRLVADQQRLDWLDKNLFASEPDEFDRKYGRCSDGKTNMWAMFAPNGVQGSARSIIDAARTSNRG